MKRTCGIIALCLLAGLNLFAQRHFNTCVTFDDLGRTHTETYADGSVVAYHYGTELDIPTEVTYQHAGGGSYVFVENVTFAPNGAIQTITIPGGQQTWLYDSQERLATQWFTYNGETLFQVQDMVYNHWGGLAGYERMDDSLQAEVSYSYTGQEQLATFTVGGNTAGYQYDAAGNLTLVQGFTNHANQVSVSDYQLPDGASYSQNNRRSDWEYDDGGRLTRDDKLLYYYNEVGKVAMIRDRLTRIPLQTYIYDYDGNRVRTTDIRTGETTYTVRNGAGLVLSEIIDSADGPDSVVNYILHNGQVIGKVEQVWGQPEVVSRHYRDHLGSPVVTIDDQQIINHEYAPFGQQMSDPKHVGAHGYTGHEDEEATGLIYMRARWQDPVTARFTTPDPARDFNSFKPASYNLYQYVHNNPVTLTDPTGLGIGEDNQNLGWRYWEQGNYFMGMFYNFLGAAQKLTGQDAASTIVDDSATTDEKIVATTEMAYMLMTAGFFSGVPVKNLFASSTDDIFRAASPAFSNLKHASKYGIKSFKELKNLVPKGSGLERHHLIEKRFARLLELDEGEMLSIVLTKSEHQGFTKIWRNLIPYGQRGNKAPNRESVLQAARDIYSSYPEILKALGL